LDHEGTKITKDTKGLERDRAPGRGKKARFAGGSRHEEMKPSIFLVNVVSFVPSRSI
jgi:hypothetical protein